MRLLNVPSCNCSKPFDRVLALRDNGDIYCARCHTAKGGEKPYFVDVPPELVEIVEGLTKVADLNIVELRPQVRTTMLGEGSNITMIKAATPLFDGGCDLQWGTVKFPLPGHIRPECNQLRGKAIDLRKLSTATSPEVRNFLKLLHAHGFVVTEIKPWEKSSQRMFLECWFGPDVEDGTPHEKLVVRIALEHSLNVPEGLQKVLNTLNIYKSGRMLGRLPYGDTVQEPLNASLEASFAMPSMCMNLLEEPYRYALCELAKANPRHAESLIEAHPEMEVAIRAAAEESLLLEPEKRPSLGCSERDALYYVCGWAEYHIASVKARIAELVDPAEEPTVSKERPKRLQDMRQPSGFDETAAPHVDFIDAVYALFLRIPAQVIKMEAATKRR